MLCITRKIGERFFIEGGIGVQVLDVRGDKVRLGVDAPKSRKIARGELLDLDENNEPFEPLWGFVELGGEG